MDTTTHDHIEPITKTNVIPFRGTNKIPTKSVSRIAVGCTPEKPIEVQKGLVSSSEQGIFY